MKYIDADRLKAKIERLMDETKSMKPSFDQFWAGQISAFKGAIKIIASLQQEQPEVDLEKEVDEYISDYLDGNDEGKVYVMQCASHFYKLGRLSNK